MKTNAIIAIFTLLLLLCFASLAVASTEENAPVQKQMTTKPIYEPQQTISYKMQNFLKNICKSFKKFIFFQHLFLYRNNLYTEKNLLCIIVSYLTVKDVVHFRATSGKFEILLSPNDAMLTCVYEQEEGKVKTLSLNWFDLKFFLEEQYLSLATMEIFQVQKDQYAAILEKGKKIISFHHGKKSFMHVLFEEATQFLRRRPNHRFTTNNQDFLNVESVNGYKGKRCESKALIILSNHGAKIGLWPNGEVETWGDKFFGGGREIKNVQMIFSSSLSFGALTTTNRFFQWPTTYMNISVFPDIKLVASNHDSFLMLSKGGKIYSLAKHSKVTKIPEKILPHLKNIKMIFSNHLSFTVLLENGELFYWGFRRENFLMKNVKTVVSTDNSFAALMHNGDIYTFGHFSKEEFIKKNGQEIFSNKYAFCALVTENRILIAWGKCEYGGCVPKELTDEKNIQTIYSTKTGFVAVLHDGRYWAWGFKSEFLEHNTQTYSYELTEVSKYLKRNILK